MNQVFVFIAIISLSLGKVIPFIGKSIPRNKEPNTKPTTKSYTFISLGDWGGYLLGGYHADNVISIANASLEIVKSQNAKMVLNSGDNFYYCGIQNISDYQIKRDYLDLFGQLNIPWYNSLGNHDYGYNVSAQTKLDLVIPNWKMDDRYYYHRIPIDTSEGENMHLIVLDTNPCVSSYRSNNKTLWDPCNIKYPTCSLTRGNDTFEGECQFHSNIIMQDCEKQYNWFLETLYNVSLNWDITVDWVIVMGHHPVDEIDVMDFGKIINTSIIDLYINGHKHELQHYSVDGNAKYLTTGAGSMVEPNVLEVENENWNDNNDKEKKILWKKKITGFTIHQIVNKQLKTQFLDAELNVLYEMIIKKKSKSD